MYISASTYGGIDWHDSRTIYEQLKYNDSYSIHETLIPQVIADDIAKTYFYVKNIKERVQRAVSEKSCFRLAFKSEKRDDAGNITYQDCEIYEENGKIYYENEATFNGSELTLIREYGFGQVSYITEYHAEDIPDDQLGYVVTEDFLAPAKGVPLVQRLYHDIFDDLEAAQNYAQNFRLHKLKYPKSIVTFRVCNKRTMSEQSWYQMQKEAMRLMEEKGYTYLDKSFRIFAEKHIENLKNLK